jgi:outer membrane murein-binding lipoprotein Lpp
LSLRFHPDKGSLGQHCSFAMKKLVLTALCAATLILSGCSSIMPARKEFFQDKVQKFPEESAAFKESQRRAAFLAEQRVAAALGASLIEGVSTNVLDPGRDALRLTGALSDSLGSPRHPATDAGAADELRAAMNKLDRKVESFKQANNENSGKAIEGTGLFSIPYFAWIGIILALGFVGLIIAGIAWAALKAYALSNPPLQLGLNAVQAGAGFVRKAVSQVVAGGEKFKEALSKEINDPATVAKVQDLFRTHQRINQDADVQAVVAELTKKS